MSKIPLSVVIFTKNNEHNISDTIYSVKGWTDEIIVVDDLSCDNTVKIAQGSADKVLIKKMEVEGAHRNWANTQVRNKWVLSLDSGDKVTEELKEEIARMIEQIDFVCFSVPFKRFIGPYWVRYGSRYSAAKVRLFQKNRLVYEEVIIHPKISIDGKCGRLKHCIVYAGDQDFEHFLAHLNRQTTLEAQKWAASAKGVSGGSIARRAVCLFFEGLIGKKGWKDGFIGFMMVFFDAFYEIISYAKYRQLKRETLPNNPSV